RSQRFRLARQYDENGLRNFLSQMGIPYLPDCRGIDQVDISCYQRFKSCLGLMIRVISDQLKIIGIHTIYGRIGAEEDRLLQPLDLEEFSRFREGVGPRTGGAAYGRVRA